MHLQHYFHMGTVLDTLHSYLKFVMLHMPNRLDTAAVIDVPEDWLAEVRARVSVHSHKFSVSSSLS